MAITAHLDLRIPFYEVDSMRMAWHGHFAKYFEQARCRLLEEIGHDYGAMFESGYAWPIVDLRVRYMRPLRFNQWVRVTATLKRWDSQLRIGYRIRDRETGGILVRGYTLQVPVDINTGTLCTEQPPEVRAALEKSGISKARLTSGD